jgi:UMF1 family MFS transporter
MTTAILPIYYLSLFVDAESVELRVLGGTWHTSGLALWGYTSALSMFLVVLVAPVLGAIADLARGKKPLLAACVFAGALATAGISLAAEGEYLLCSAFYVVANFLWSAGNVFYDGFLPELTDDPRRMDAISASGYAVGYVGGGLALLLSLLIIGAHEPIGLTEAGAARVTFLLVALWWVVFTIPLLLLVRESGCAPLLAFLLYNSGVGTVIIIAAAYGRQELGLSQETLIGCILVIQFLGLPATLAYIALGRKVGTRASILIGLGVYMAVVVYAMQIETATEFWILGILVGLVQGGIQAMSRSLYGAVIPQGMSAEFFGFFSVFNKIGPFFGPLLFAGVKDATGSSRLAILFLITFFVLGFLVLLTVRGERGREEAKIFVLDEQ